MKKITYVKNNKNLGVSVGWNQGLKVALNTNSKHLLLVNNDIIFDIDCIDLLSTKLRTTLYKLIAANHEEKRPGEDHQVFWSCFMLTRSVIATIGYFDENFWPARCEDEDYHWRCDIVGIQKGRLFNAKVLHENNGTAKFNKDPEVKSINWAYYLGQNAQYLQKK
ncbi:MAG: hypothetical protein HQ538_02580, partial [Parcubacteria group bacterium]|nr:hypothetical protein [Parcubacteria group bacterium]